MDELGASNEGILECLVGLRQNANYVAVRRSVL